MNIDIDPRDYMTQEDFDKLRKEAMDELLSEHAPRVRHFLTDLVDARAAILGHRYADALTCIERAIAEVRHGND